MVKEFVLVNPKIAGNFNIRFKANSANQASKQAYKSLSELFSNSVPQFGFTLQQVTSDQQLGGGNGKYHHFTVVEKMNSAQKVSYDIHPAKIHNKVQKDFQKQLQQISKKHATINKNIPSQSTTWADEMTVTEQDGGKHSTKDWSLEDDDSDDEWMYNVRPKYTLDSLVYNWWYYPYLYDMGDYYLPTLVPPIAPVVTVAGFPWRFYFP